MTARPSSENVPPITDPVRLLNKHVLALNMLYGPSGTERILKALVPALNNCKERQIEKQALIGGASSLTRRWRGLIDTQKCKVADPAVQGSGPSGRSQRSTRRKRRSGQRRR